jgi:hypothetical protein
MLGRSTVILIDASASMGSKELGKTRLEEAGKKAHALIDSIAAGEEQREIMLIAFSNRARVLSTFTSDTGALKRALDSLVQTDTPTSIDEAMQGAASHLSDRAEAEVYIISDGALGAVAPPEKLDAKLHFVGVGRNASNLAITAMDVRRAQDELDKHQVFVTVENYSAEAFTGALNLFFDGDLLDSAEVTVQPGGRVSRVFGDYQITSGVMKAVIEADDDLAADNAAYQIVKRGSKYRAMLVSDSPGKAFIERIYRSDPLVSCRTVSTAEFESEFEDADMSEYDLVIFDCFAPVKLGKGNFLFLGAIPPIEGFKKKKESANDVILYSEPGHPLMSMVSLKNVFVRKLIVADVPERAVPLAEATCGTLAAAVFDKDVRVVYMGFDYLESDWPFKTSFPVFFTNTLRYMGELSRAQKTRRIIAGGPITLRGPAGAKEVVVTAPDGVRHVLPVSADGRAEFARTNRVGLYTFRVDGEDKDRYFAVNLLDAEESSLRIPEGFKMGSEQVAASDVEVGANKEIWKYLAILALVVLFLEWYVYNRKVRI